VVISTISYLELILTEGKTIMREIKVMRRLPRRDSLVAETKKIERTNYQEKNRSVDVAEAATTSEEEVASLEEETSETLPKWLRPTKVRNTTSILNNYAPETEGFWGFGEIGRAHV